MKKLFTLLLGGMIMLVSTAMAAAPQVVLSAPANYDLSIDGRMYSPNPTTVINNLAMGTHTVEVYRVTSSGIFGLGKKRELLSRQQFNLRNNDINITVDQSGRLRINNEGYNNDGRYSGKNGGYGNRERDREHRDGREDDRYDNRDEKGRYGRSEGKGRGHKYGHYKKQKGNPHGHQDKKGGRHNEEDDRK